MPRLSTRKTIARIGQTSKTIGEKYCYTTPFDKLGQFVSSIDKSKRTWKEKLLDEL